VQGGEGGGGLPCPRSNPPVDATVRSQGPTPHQARTALPIATIVSMDGIGSTLEPRSWPAACQADSEPHGPSEKVAFGELEDEIAGSNAYLSRVNELRHKRDGTTFQPHKGTGTGKSNSLKGVVPGLEHMWVDVGRIAFGDAH